MRSPSSTPGPPTACSPCCGWWSRCRCSAPWSCWSADRWRAARSTRSATSSVRRCRSAPSSISLVLFFALLGRDEDERQVSQQLFTWFQAGQLDVGFDLLYDPLSALFLLLITGVGSLIHVYSIGYMAHDARRPRFFGYLNLFVAAMLMLVLSANYLGLFLGWEGVGLASYLLIGFWQHKHSAAAAAKKAFVINRVGDIGLSLAIALMFVTFGTTDFTRHQRRRPGRRRTAS